MAKLLKDILKQAHDTIKGVRPSTTTDGSLGKDPGVDYKPKAGDEQDFVAKHSIQKFDDPNGNGSDVFQGTNVKYSIEKEKLHGYKKPEDKKVNESKKAEDVKCNMSEAGTWCPMHEMANCSSSKKLNELDRQQGSILNRYISKTNPDYSSPKELERRKEGRALALKKKWGDKTYGLDEPKVKAVTREEVEQVDEAGMPASVIKGKQNRSYMTDKEFAEKHAHLSDAELRSMAWRHGYGKPGTHGHEHYVNRRAKGLKEEVENIEELSKETLQSYKKKALALDKPDKSPKQSYNRLVGIARSARKIDAKEEVEQVDEVITKKTSAGDVISDFVHSDNPKFAGKSKEERKRMALGAYYSKQSEQKEEVQYFDENYVEYHLRNVDKNDKDQKKILETINSHKGKFVGASNRGAIVSVHKHKVYDFLKDMKMHGVHPDPIERFTEETGIKEWNAVEPLLGGNPPRGDSEEAAQMVKTELKALANKAMHLVMQMPDSMHVEPWCQSKIAVAKEMVSAVHDYMIYGEHDKPEDEQMDTPLTFPNMSVDVNTGQNV